MRFIPLKVKRMIKEGYMDLRDFGPKVAIAKCYCIMSDESINAVKFKNQIILEYLLNEYGYLVERYQNKDVDSLSFKPDESKKLPIWGFWWDGMQTMPEVIQTCHASKLKNAKEHPVVLLTKENIREYIEFPEYVWKQFDEKKLRIQHLADMIRVQLIRRYGGLWLDASIYCKKEIKENMFQESVYSLKGENDERYVSNNQWTTFVIGGCKENILCSFLDDFFIDYCKSGKRFIDYFMFDCAIALAYKHIPKVKKAMDLIPKAEGDYYWLNKNLEQPFSEELQREYEKQESVFQKIAWNREFAKQVDTYTLYQYILEEELYE